MAEINFVEIETDDWSASYLIPEGYYFRQVKKLAKDGKIKGLKRISHNHYEISNDKQSKVLVSLIETYAYLHG